MLAPMTTLEILDKLVAFPTVSRDSNRDLIEFIRSFLAERNIEAELICTADGRKANLFATVGSKNVPGVMLSGHTDVVPVDDQNWSIDPFRMQLLSGRIYGRGTADMKGFLACVLSLVGRMAGTTLSKPIHLAFSHDEEVGCIGVRSLIDELEKRPVKPRFVIVGEPTLMRLATGHKGKIAARATCCGVEGHSALAPKALNAIHLACDFVGFIRQSQKEIVEAGSWDESYDVPYTTLHVGQIEGGTALNIVPGKCTVDFEIRNIGRDDGTAILDRLVEGATRIAMKRRSVFPQADIRVDVMNEYPGLTTPLDSEVVRFARRIVDHPNPFNVAFGTEAGLFSSRLGVPAVVCGPGSMDQGHKPDEFVALSQIEACDRMMDRLLDECR
ncbi:acetylornithine deacetylase [Bradyrhizobium canariense]|uniref:Acetylornithine deacetylase n=2 Tax=Bradyrhizobium canariense TaxID=255045 RepID=A0A1H1XMF0_9BRAD|nr:acetylornithine deacetylase [Bradyrhizobium canariense]